MSKILDSGALLGFFRNQSAADAVQELIVKAERSRQRLWITPLTWGELYGTALRQSQETARRFMREMAALPIEVYTESVDFPMTREAARIRIECPGIEFSDSFSIALAKIKRAELWTTRPDLPRIAGDVRIKVLSATENR